MVVMLILEKNRKRLATLTTDKRKNLSSTQFLRTAFGGFFLCAVRNAVMFLSSSFSMYFPICTMAVKDNRRLVIKKISITKQRGIERKLRTLQNVCPTVGRMKGREWEKN